jgi:hypothetical protein
MVSTFGLFLFELKREPDNFPAAAGERSFSMNNKVVNGRKVINTISKSKIISRRQGEEATRRIIHTLRKLTTQACAGQAMLTKIAL